MPNKTFFFQVPVPVLITRVLMIQVPESNSLYIVDSLDFEHQMTETFRNSQGEVGQGINFRGETRMRWRETWCPLFLGCREQPCTLAITWAALWQTKIRQRRIPSQKSSVEKCHRTKWCIFQQAMLDYGRVNQSHDTTFFCLFNIPIQSHSITTFA